MLRPVDSHGLDQAHMTRLLERTHSHTIIEFFFLNEFYSKQKNILLMNHDVTTVGH